MPIRLDLHRFKLIGRRPLTHLREDKPDQCLRVHFGWVALDVGRFDDHRTARHGRQRQLERAGYFLEDTADSVVRIDRCRHARLGEVRGEDRRAQHFGNRGAFDNAAVTVVGCEWNRQHRVGHCPSQLLFAEPHQLRDGKRCGRTDVGADSPVHLPSVKCVAQRAEQFVREDDCQKNLLRT